MVETKVSVTLSCVSPSQTEGIATAAVFVRGPSSAAVFATSCICDVYQSAPGVEARLRERGGSPGLCRSPSADRLRLRFAVLDEDKEWLAAELAGLLEVGASYPHRRPSRWRRLFSRTRRRLPRPEERVA
jgi:hypothetical protein